jgi:hypothetical protein
LLTRAKEFLRSGRLNNVRPGMVWLLAIGVPIALRHAESRLVSSARDRRRVESKLAEGTTTAPLRFFHHAM